MLQFFKIFNVQKRKATSVTRNVCLTENTQQTINLGGEQEVEHEEVVQLTTLTKVEDTEEVSTPGNQLHPGYFSLENQAPMEVFSRKYLITDISFGIASTFEFHPFDLISERSIMSSILTKHKYFRADAVEIDVQVTAPISASGFMVAYWFPCMSSSALASNPSNNYNKYTWKDFVPMDFGTLAYSDSESLQMQVKWQHARFAAENPIVGRANAATLKSQLQGLGMFRLENIHLSQVDQANPTVRVRVYASYVNPYLAGPILPNVPAFEFQSDARNFGTATGMFVSAKQLYDNVGGAQGIYNAAKGAVAEGALINQAFETVKPALETGYCTFFDCEEKTPEENDKLPVRGNHLSMRTNVYGDTAALMPPSNVLSLDSTPMMGGIEPSMLGTTTESSIYSLCRRWCYASDGTLIPGDASSLLANTVAPHLMANGFMRMFSNFFRFWRGTIEFQFNFFGSPLVTYQVGISVNWERTNNASVNTPLGRGGIGNTLFKMVTVRGTTSVEFSVPYMRQTPWDRMNSFNAPIIQVTVYPVGSYMGTNNNIPLPILVLTRAGSDFRFRSLTSGGKTKSDPTINPNTSDPTDYEFQGLIDHTMSTDVVNCQPILEKQAFHGSIKDILFRASHRLAGNWWFIPGEGRMTTPISLDSTGDNFDILANMFAFYSGSFIIRAKIADPGPDNDQPSVFLLDMGGKSAASEDFAAPRFGRGTYKTSNDQWRFMEVSVPLVSTVAMLPINRVIDFVENAAGNSFDYFTRETCFVRMSNDTTTVLPEGPVLVSADHDFALHVMFPPLNSAQLNGVDPQRNEYVAPALTDLDNRDKSSEKVKVISTNKTNQRFTVI